MDLLSKLCGWLSKVSEAVVVEEVGGQEVDRAAIYKGR